MTEQDSKTVKSPRNAAYGAAMQALKAAHPEEWETLYEKECANHGVVYKKRMTAEERQAQVEAEKLEKARAKVEALKAQYPDLFTA